MAYAIDEMLDTLEKKNEALEDEANRLAQELDLRQSELRRARAALEECLEYFQERQDGEYIDGKPVGNQPMRMASMIEEALGRGGRYGL